MNHPTPRHDLPPLLKKKAAEQLYLNGLLLTDGVSDPRAAYGREWSTGEIAKQETQNSVLNDPSFPAFYKASCKYFKEQTSIKPTPEFIAQELVVDNKSPDPSLFQKALGPQEGLNFCLRFQKLFSERQETGQSYCKDIQKKVNDVLKTETADCIKAVEASNLPLTVKENLQKVMNLTDSEEMESTSSSFWNLILTPDEQRNLHIKYYSIRWMNSVEFEKNTADGTFLNVKNHQTKITQNIETIKSALITSQKPEVSNLFSKLETLSKGVNSLPKKTSLQELDPNLNNIITSLDLSNIITSNEIQSLQDVWLEESDKIPDWGLKSRAFHTATGSLLKNIRIFVDLVEDLDYNLQDLKEAEKYLEMAKNGQINSPHYQVPSLEVLTESAPRGQFKLSDEPVEGKLNLVFFMEPEGSKFSDTMGIYLGDGSLTLTIHSSAEGLNLARLVSQQAQIPSELVSQYDLHEMKAFNQLLSTSGKKIMYLTSDRPPEKI